MVCLEREAEEAGEREEFFRETQLDRPVKEIKGSLLAQLNDFLEGETLQDDLTLIMVRHAG